jgi:large subunit ribosomal protein L9
MKVVFLEEVEGTARTGDVKNVADGFARNYLLPRKLAAPATDHYITMAEARATQQARAQARLDEDAQKILPKVDGKQVTIEVRVGDQDKLFGSVTSRDIAELLTTETKVELEHRQVDIKQPIRELGAHEVPVKLTRNVIANVTVGVVPIGMTLEDYIAKAEAAAAASMPAVPGPAEAAEEEAPAAEDGEESTPEAGTTAEAEEPETAEEAAEDSEPADEPAPEEETSPETESAGEAEPAE